MARPRFARTVVLLPNGFTLANLFLGVFAIVAAARGDYSRAGTYIVLGGIADALDGRIARATSTGSRFGAELDSLVDAITFGVAPAMIMFFAVLNQHGWEWVFCYLFVMCAVIRLARFNVQQAGRAKTHFIGLPSPAAGMTLATYYWFSQTPLYNQTILASLPWPVMLRYIMVALAFLMISNVKYAAVPLVGFRSVREILGSLVVFGTMIGVIFLPKEFFFPALMTYVVYGVLRTFVVGLFEPSPAVDEELLLEAPADGTDGTMTEAELEAGAALHRRRRRRRRLRGGRPIPPETKPHEEHRE